MRRTKCYRLFLLLAIGVLVVGLGCNCQGPLTTKSPEPASTNSLARVHFLGTTKLAGDTNAFLWKNIAELPESKRLWQQILVKISRIPFQIALTNGAESTNDFALVFQELLTDVMRSESFFEIAGNRTNSIQYGLAIRLANDRSEFWRTNLATIAEDWERVRVSQKENGWSIDSVKGSAMQFSRSGDWVMIGWGQGAIILCENHLQRIQQSQNSFSPSNHWINISFDCRRLPDLYPKVFAALNSSSRHILPVGKFDMAGKGANLRIQGDVEFPSRYEAQYGSWQIPTNLIRDPIIGFTALRGADVATHVCRLFDFPIESMLNDYKLDQAFTWTGSGYPTLTMAAAPTQNATELVRTLGRELISRFSDHLESHNAGVIGIMTNSASFPFLRWKTPTPFMRPFVTTTQYSERGFVFGGLFPNWPGTNPPPALFHYLSSKPNLVYYDWEITSQRFASWRSVVNIFRHIFEKPRLENETASIGWINAVSNHLGNSVTEVTHISTNKYEVVRQGTIGLTAIELIALAHWIESPGFPLNLFSGDLSDRNSILRSAGNP